MTVGFLFAIAAMILVFSMLAACAVRALLDFPRHELKEYCDRKDRPQRYEQIMAVNEELAVATQSVQMALLCIGLIFASGGFFQWQNSWDSPFLMWVVAGLALSALMLVSQVWIPVALASTASVPFLYYTWPMWKWVSRCIHPFFIGVRFTSAFFGRVAGHPVNEEDPEEFDDEIMSVVSEYVFDGEVGQEEHRMIEGVIKLDDNDVGSVMTPRSKVDSLAVDSGWNQMIETLLETQRSRLPVYEKNRDNIVGMLFAKDVLAEAVKPEHERSTISDLIRKPLTVTENTRLNHLLKLFLESRVHMAIVVDEAFAVAGIVTIEDVIEEIVGEIVDEVDPEEPILIRQITEGEAVIDGNAAIDDINEQLNTQFPENGDYDTIAGLILTYLKDIPERGDEFEIEDVTITIEQSSKRQIQSIRVKIA